MTQLATSLSQVLLSIEAFTSTVQHQEEHLSGGHTTHDLNCNPERIQLDLNSLQSSLARLLQAEPSPAALSPIVSKLVEAGNRITRFPSLVMILSFFAGSLVERGGVANEEASLMYVSTLERVINEAYQFTQDHPEAVEKLNEDHGHSHGGGDDHGHSHGGHGHAHGGHDDEEEEEECSDEEHDHHGHSHAHGGHGHSHAGGDHGHSHGGHDDHDEEECSDEEHDHGHSHGGHGHAHGGHDDHGHSHAGGHDHSHGGHDDHGHSHGGHDDHGHSHGGHGHGGHDDHGHSHGGHDDHGHSHGGHGGHGHSHAAPEPEPEGQEAFEALGRMSPPSSLFLSAAPAAAFGKLARKAELLDKMSDLRWKSPGLKMLHGIVSVLMNEKVVVIHPEEKKGYVVRISGVSDNHQLHTILRDVLCGLGEGERLQGTRPSPDVMECLTNPKAPQQLSKQISGEWDMIHWVAALGKPEEVNIKDFIWGEGVPADISKFRGERVVLLRRPVYNRGWNCVRVFRPLAAQVKLERVMTPEEVQKYLADFQGATEEEKAAARSFIDHPVKQA